MHVRAHTYAHIHAHTFKIQQDVVSKFLQIYHNPSKDLWFHCSHGDKSFPSELWQVCYPSSPWILGVFTFTVKACFTVIKGGTAAVEGDDEKTLVPALL